MPLLLAFRVRIPPLTKILNITLGQVIALAIQKGAMKRKRKYRKNPSNTSK